MRRVGRDNVSTGIIREFRVRNTTFRYSLTFVYLRVSPSPLMPMMLMVKPNSKRFNMKSLLLRFQCQNSTSECEISDRTIINEQEILEPANELRW